jgi:hypothetical protein
VRDPKAKTIRGLEEHLQPIAGIVVRGQDLDTLTEMSRPALGVLFAERHEGGGGTPLKRALIIAAVQADTGGSLLGGHPERVELSEECLDFRGVGLTHSFIMRPRPAAVNP